MQEIVIWKRKFVDNNYRNIWSSKHLAATIAWTTCSASLKIQWTPTSAQQTDLVWTRRRHCQRSSPHQCQRPNVRLHSPVAKLERKSSLDTFCTRVKLEKRKSSRIQRANSATSPAWLATSGVHCHRMNDAAGRNVLRPSTSKMQQNMPKKWRRMRTAPARTVPTWTHRRHRSHRINFRCNMNS